MSAPIVTWQTSSLYSNSCQVLHTCSISTYNDVMSLQMHSFSSVTVSGNATM